MKQLLFLLLFPCLALAQYPGNANQKITLGEQTTADGLVYRGVASIDTVAATSKITRANKQDTSAFILLDTVTNLLWHYKTGSNAWTQAGGSPLTNPVTGTGTTNYIPKFTSSSAIGSSVIYESGGNVGINTTSSPAEKLTVNGKGLFENNSNAVQQLIIKNTTAGSNSEAYLYVISDNDAGSGTLGKYSSTKTPYKIIGASNTYLYNGIAGDIAIINDFGSGAIKMSAGGSSTAQLTLNASGNVGIGTTSPSALLNVMGTVRINSASAPDANYYLQLENSSSQKAKANAWDTYSDRRIKTDIQPIFNAIEKVNLLNPVYYQKHDSYVENDFLNIDYDNSVKSLGFIAQEVYNVIPEAVNTGTTNELWAMDYTKIIPILTKAIQEQQALIKALEQRIINFENK